MFWQIICYKSNHLVWAGILKPNKRRSVAPTTTRVKMVTGAKKLGAGKTSQLLWTLMFILKLFLSEIIRKDQIIS